MTSAIIQNQFFCRWIKNLTKPIPILRNAWQWFKVKKNFLMSLLELDRHNITSIRKGLNFILQVKQLES